jgi:hypothetical protein
MNPTIIVWGWIDSSLPLSFCGQWLCQSPDRQMRQWLLMPFGLQFYQHLHLLYDILNWLLITPVSACAADELLRSVPSSLPTSCL